ncbi:MAG: hypothetical protein IK095_01315 [Oscillospiraceae bacterium]|nr:hypothetical protein [Oscillospiraceae bacterium]
MHGLEGDTIGGFNSLIEKQKREPGKCFVTTVLFDNTMKTLHDRVELQEIQPLTERDYRVGGCTALLDALGGTIRHIVDIHRYARREDVPARTTFVIITDGMENASRQYDSAKVKSMIEHEKSKYGWEFLFLAANIDAVETARHMGIDADRSVNYHADARGTQMAYAAVEQAVMARRKFAAPLNASWRQDVDEDYESRK